jgi:hypothetical protein
VTSAFPAPLGTIISQPGNDGGPLPDAFEWRRGLVFTAKTRIPTPLLRGQEYRIAVSFKRKIGAAEKSTGYADLYRHAMALANARIARLYSTCGHPHTWIVRHGWRSFGDSGDIGCAFLTMGLICPKERDTKPQGETRPTPLELMIPGGAAIETLAHADLKRVDEIHNEFDFSDSPSLAAQPFMVSYGERVPTCERVDFYPFIERAETFVNFYDEGVLRHEEQSKNRILTIRRREWYCVRNPNLVVVQVYFE